MRQKAKYQKRNHIHVISRHEGSEVSLGLGLFRRDGLVLLLFKEVLVSVHVNNNRPPASRPIYFCKSCIKCITFT